MSAARWEMPRFRKLPSMLPDDDCPPTPSVTVGIDSYVALADADQIASDRLFAAPWERADAATRCAALRTATELLDGMRWQGRPVVPTQTLAWPRVPDRCPYGYPITAAIPVAIERACVELAIHLLRQGQHAGAPVQMRQLGDAMTSYFPTVADELPKHVRRLIEPHLVVSSANVAEIAL